jgi:hypothetical protein
MAVLKPVAQQIAEYKQQFVFAERYRTWKQENPTASFRDESIFRSQLRSDGWDLGYWSWDEAWDGRLISDVEKLAEHFVIQKFYRKRKINLRQPKGLNREETVAAIVMLVGSDWTGIAFSKQGIQLWWKGGGPSNGRSYR